MTVNEMAQTLGLQHITSQGGENPVEGVYACDLLSRVMSGCKANDAWITVQTHLNVLAVAELNEAACIIVPEGINVEAATVEKAEEKGVAILAGSQGTYELCWRLHEMLS